jgi:hypothetical protein
MSVYCIPVAIMLQMKLSFFAMVSMGLLRAARHADSARIVWLFNSDSNTTVSIAETALLGIGARSP